MSGVHRRAFRREMLAAFSSAGTRARTGPSLSLGPRLSRSCLRSSRVDESHAHGRIGTGVRRGRSAPMGDRARIYPAVRARGRAVGYAARTEEARGAGRGRLRTLEIAESAGAALMVSAVRAENEE